MIGSARVMSRRTFLRDLGHAACALAVVGVAGCVRGPVPTVRPTTVGPTRTFDPMTYVGNLDEIESFWCSPTFLPPTAPVLGPDSDHANGRWARFGNAGFAGYVLVRGGEATVIDTGPWCVSDAIEGGLKAVGLDWTAVGSVIVTHKHPDHWIGLSSAFERAVDAVPYAGAADIPHIASSRPIVAVGAGDRVMDLAIIPSPGHTPGHIAVHDEAAGVLVVGDAIGVREGHGLEISAGTTEDLPQAQASLGILAALSFDTLLPGHGDPIIGGAWEALSEYLAPG